MADKIRLDFAKGTVKRDIAEIPNKLLEGAEEAILEVAQLMKAYAIYYVAVDWGNLRDTIRVERGGRRMYWRQVRVRAGGYPMKRGPRAGEPVNYAAIVETRQPYMKPAWREVQPEAQAIIRRICLEHIKEIKSAGVLRFP